MAITSTIQRIQLENKEWAWRNFGDEKSVESWQPLVGAMEELGELSHAHLKAYQGIRNSEDHESAKKDAIGDIVIYLMDYCNREGFDLERCVKDTWREVQKRDWQKNQVNGKV